jgi:23S rRNA pseudouridine1911/1915/1917 synthase
MKEPAILFENENLLVINKPAGLVVHADGKTAEPNLCDWLIQKYPNIKEVGEPAKAPDGKIIYRPGIVHRLDRETSGAMIIAKNQASFEFLKEQFQNRQVHKTYNTFVWGLFKENKGEIDRPIGRSKGDFRRWSAGRFARGEMREAVTEYKVLESRTFSSLKEASVEGSEGASITPAVSFVEARPLTGRTHQIRVHMHFLHHPVVGDSLYAPNHPNILGFKRLALHSRVIEFTDVGGGLLRIEAPYPEDFESALKLFQGKDEKAQ